MTKPYIKPINPNSDDSHQTSPHWLLTFVRFDIRDTYNYDSENYLSTRNPLVIENDCISINVSLSKTNYTPKATATLMSGDLNYGTAVSPGDFFMVNIVNSSKKARELRIRAGNKQAINRAGDGFKGIFKVNTVNKIIQTEPNTGVKTVRYQIAGYGFTEFNTAIYFNPLIATSLKNENLLYQLNSSLLEVISSKKNVQEVLEKLPYIILGLGIQSNIDLNSITKTPFEIPKLVFELLGYPKSKTGNNAIDLYKIMLGVWEHRISKTSSIKDGFNPDYEDFYSLQKTKKTLEGQIPIQTSPLTNVSLIELMKRFSNSLINEMYTCYRIDKDSGLVLPKLIVRQKPFNTLHGNIEGTNFLLLPRWDISPDLIYSINVSKNESLRFNLVHIMGTTGQSDKDGSLLAFQDGEQKNFKADLKDIKKHGVKPFTHVSNFDWIDNKSGSRSGYWADLCFDWVYGGHLRLNGTMQSVGIEEDICIGDNLQLHNTVFHIESISHTANITANGKKMFRTNLQLTHGIDKRSNIKGPIYPEMDFTDTRTDRIDDYNSGTQIMPGFSDTQDILGRKNGEETIETKEKSFTPSNIKK